MPRQTAILAAGCFWGVEGGRARDAGEGAKRDPAKISYPELLEVFWAEHDPTVGDRQGWDIGSQYRSAIFFGDKPQAAEAIASRGARQNRLERKIVTEITPAGSFWPAEDYHQQFLEKSGQADWAVTVEVPGQACRR